MDSQFFIESNKKYIEEFLKKFKNKDIAGILDDMDERCIWWVGGKPELFPLAGNKSKSEMKEILSGIVLSMKNGLVMTVKAMTAEGNRVAAEVESYGENPDGSIYNNEYHFLFVIEEGKLIEVKEYLDTMHTHEIFIDKG
jgi:ketosteroid isomerase-like protein